MIYYLLAILAMIGIMYLSYENYKKWEDFRIEHHCKIAVKIDDDMTVGGGAKWKWRDGSSRGADTRKDRMDM